MTSRQLFIAIAYEELNKKVQEVGGDNKGPDVQKYQRAADGKAEGESWCLGFVQWCLDEVERRSGFSAKVDRTTENVWTFFHAAPSYMVNKLIAIDGAVMCWNVPGTTKGHAGIVVGATKDARLQVIEGNTNDAGSREGGGKTIDGVRLKSRSMAGDPKTFAVLGWVDPFVIEPILIKGRG